MAKALSEVGAKKLEIAYVLYRLINFSGFPSMQPYFPPYFTKNDRIAKIQAILPEIDLMYKECAEKNRFPGYAYGIIVDGELIRSGGGGFIDVDKKIPSTSRSMFRIASMTKSFTAMAILKLRDENRLKLDDPIRLYIPDMQKQQLTEDAPLITIRDLLTHSAGFPTDDPWADRKLNATEEELLALFQQGVFFSSVPGTAYEYSNLGYALLGYIIKKITGVPYQTFILETICQPLGMQEVSWDFTEVPQSRLAHGYKRVNEEWKEEPLLQDGVFGAMGGMMISIESFSQYAAFHLSAWPSRNDKETGPIKRSSAREMHRPWRVKELPIDKDPNDFERTSTNAYGYGLNWLRDSKGRTFVGHSGGLPGFGCNWFMMPEYGLGAILFANVTYAQTAKANLDALDKLIADAALSPRRFPPSNLLKERQNALVKLLPNWQNAAESGLFADNFFLDFSIESLKRQAKQLFAEAGKIISIGEVLPDNQLRGHFIIEGEKIDLQVTLALTPQNPPLIQHYHIKEVEKAT